MRTTTNQMKGGAGFLSLVLTNWLMDCFFMIEKI